MTLLASWLDHGARYQAALMALRTPRGAWSYGQLAELAGHGGGFLRSEGVAVDEIVGFAAGPVELALAALACSAAGAVLLPLDPRLPDAAWAHWRALAGGRLRRLTVLPAEWFSFAAPCTIAGKVDDLALVIATSGSAGVPKGVMLTRGNLDAAAAAANWRLPLAAGDVWLGCLPLYHIGGISLLYRCLRAGATLLLHEDFSAAAVWRDLHQHAVTHISLVPVMLARLLEVAAGRSPPADLRHALIGGGALSRPLLETALAAGWPICPTWGMSESAAQAATLTCPGNDWQPGQVGEFLPGLEGRIAADGRIHLKGAQVMAGYLNPQRRRGYGLDDGWLPTADLGRFDAAGRLTVLGRADDVLVSGGVNVHPHEVENCLAACPGVSDVAVTAVADPVWGDALVALIVGPAESHVVDQWLRQHLPAAKRPRRIRRIGCLPRNSMGKLERAHLQRLALGLS